MPLKMHWLTLRKNINFFAQLLEFSYGCYTSAYLQLMR